MNAYNSSKVVNSSSYFPPLSRYTINRFVQTISSNPRRLQNPPFQDKKANQGGRHYLPNALLTIIKILSLSLSLSRIHDSLNNSQVITSIYNEPTTVNIYSPHNTHALVYIYTFSTIDAKTSFQFLTSYNVAKRRPLRALTSIYCGKKTSLSLPYRFPISFINPPVRETLSRLQRHYIASWCARTHTHARTMQQEKRGDKKRESRKRTQQEARMSRALERETTL